jgi:3',5'-cyclic AMP phosphodiesterase CpdA
MRIVQITDTHLSTKVGLTAANLERIAAFVNEQLRPDLIVHTGDIVVISPDVPEDRALALAAHGAFDAPIRFLSGNHDVGEPGPAPWAGLGVSSARIAAHREMFGPDRFVEHTPDWTIVGLASELMGSGLPEEEEQWNWLTEALSEPASTPVALFLHKAIFPDPSLPAHGEASMWIAEPARERLMAIAGGRIASVGSGHLHHFIRREREELLEIWGPSTAFIPRGHLGQVNFDQLGVVEWRLEPGGQVDAWFRAPVDLEEKTHDQIPEIDALIQQELQRGLAEPVAR